MLYLSSTSISTHVQEPPTRYSPTPPRTQIYEIALRVNPARGLLKDLQSAHRMVQALRQGEILGNYEVLDFLIWPQGVFTRIFLRDIPRLSDFLSFLKEKAVPAGEEPSRFWEEEPPWIRLVAPKKLAESTRSFLVTAEALRHGMESSGGFTPNLYFFYRNPRLLP